MKLLLIGVLILSFLNSNAQSDCSAYFPYKQGTTMTYESFDKKGKLSQTEVHKVSSLQNTDTGIDATLDVKMTDKKGKDVIESSYDIECKDGVLYFDIRTMFNEEMMAPLANMDFTVEGDELVFARKSKRRTKIERWKRDHQIIIWRYWHYEHDCECDR